MFEIFRDSSPLVQPLSIDEAYLDMTPGHYSDEHPVAVADAIRRRIARLGITGSVGVATSKTVAKIASDYNKPDGLTVVWPGEESRFLAPLPVRSMPGIGPKTAERLHALGVRTIGDLAALDVATAAATMGADHCAMLERARGVDPRPVHHRGQVKSVSNERTFSDDVRSVDEVDVALTALAAKVCGRLRDKGLAGRTVTVKMRFSDFTTRTVRRTLDISTSDERTVTSVARQLLFEAWTPGVGLRLLGVGVSGFAERVRQQELLAVDVDLLADDKRRSLVLGLDAIRNRFGPDAVRFGIDIGTQGDDDQ